MRRISLPATALGALLFFYSLAAHANLTTNLQGLVTDLDSLNTELASGTFQTAGTCMQLGSLNTSIEDYIGSVENITAGLAAPLSVTDQDLASLDDLATMAKSMANQSVTLSMELMSMETTLELFEYRAALSAMLRLSDDIGTMADRILEMADRILLMADNIGLMADRILLTQQLQNTNIALTQAAILTTQQNMVTLSGSLSSIAYNVSLGLLNDDTQALLTGMSDTILSENNMATELAALETSTTALLNKTLVLYSSVVTNSQHASHYINGDTLTLLGDLSVLHNALSVALENFANSINSLSPLTDTPVLADATASMLKLARDIGIMSDRIMEMTDKIIVMADNIGVMSTRIVETQNIQQTNVDLTASSILTAQNVTISVIANMGL